MAISNDELIEKVLAPKDFFIYAWHIKNNLDMTGFHRIYYEILNKFAHGEIKKLIVTMPPQHGKAIQVDTPVLTTEGWKRHEDLSVGDYVYGDDGLPKKVLNNFGSYDWHTQEVHFADGFSIIAAKEHEWKIYADHDNHKGRIEEVKETQYIFECRNRRNPYINADAVLYNECKELPIDPYLLGLWLGDGISMWGKIVSGEEDIEYYRTLNYWKDINKPRKDYYELKVEGLTHLLRVNGLQNNKHIPFEYLTASTEQRYALLQGLMDTDGCVDKRGNCEFCQKSGQLAEDVYILIRSLGIKARKKEYKAMMYGKDCGMKTRILFNPDRTQQIFRIPRKQNRLANKTNADRNDKKRFFITSVTEHDNCRVNCIQVEGGMYLVGKQLVPTHNSEGSSRLLPTFLLGLNPDLKIVISSYALSLSRDFNKDVQAIMATNEYHRVFPDTQISRSEYADIKDDSARRTSETTQIMGHKGSLNVVGRGGALTGKTVDISILDDVYKDYEEANSPVIRESAWKWYTTVVRTRLHNNSQELIVYTRWHEDDIVGRIERKKTEPIIDITCPEDMQNVPKGTWLRVNFPAIKESEKTEFDSREKGEALWQARHSIERLLENRRLDPVQFECLYQGNPKPQEGYMYNHFKTYQEMHPTAVRGIRKCYIDTADKGADYLCAIFYNEREDTGECYVTDILYTKKPMEYTEIATADMLVANHTQVCIIESNNGGRGFGRNVENNTRQKGEYETSFILFTQTNNKESRIFSNSAKAQNMVYFPSNWEDRWNDFYLAITTHRKEGGNEHDDAADALTGVVEKIGIGITSQSTDEEYEDLLYD